MDNSPTSSRFDSHRKAGIILVALSGICWGVISLFIRKLAALGFSSMDIAALRSILACLILLCTVLCLDREALKLRLKDAWCMAGCGLASITLFNCCYFFALQHTTVNIAVVLLYTSPIFISVLSHFCFREPFGKRQILALIIVTLGCILVTGAWNGGGLSTLTPKVLLAGLGSGLFYGLYSIFGRCAQNRGYSSLAITLWSFIFSGTVSLFILDWKNSYSIIIQTPSAGLVIVGLTIICTILPYCLYTEGLKRLPASLAAIIATSEPVVGTLVGLIAFHESLAWNSIVGMVLVLAAMIIG